MFITVRQRGALAAAAALWLGACDGNPIKPYSTTTPVLPERADVHAGDILTSFSATLTINTSGEGPLSTGAPRHPASFRMTALRQTAGTWKLEISLLGVNRGATLRSVVVPGDGTPMQYLDESGRQLTVPDILTGFPGIPPGQERNQGPVLRDGWQDDFIVATSDKATSAARRERLYGRGRVIDARHDEYVAGPSPGDRVEEVVDRDTGTPTERRLFRNNALHTRTTFEATPILGGSGYLIAYARTVYEHTNQVVERTLSNVTTSFAPKQ